MAYEKKNHPVVTLSEKIQLYDFVEVSHMPVIP